MGKSYKLFMPCFAGVSTPGPSDPLNGVVDFPKIFVHSYMCRDFYGSVCHPVDKSVFGERLVIQHGQSLSGIWVGPC